MPSILLNNRVTNDKCSLSRSSTGSSNTDISSWLNKSHSYHGLPFHISNNPDTQEINVNVRGLPGYTLAKESGLLGKKYVLYDEDNLSPLYQIKSFRILGYIEISSSKFSTHLRFPYPNSSRKSYNFQMAGVKYSWEYTTDGQGLKCYNSDMVIVAQIYFRDEHSNRSSYSSFGNESCVLPEVNKLSAKLVIVPQPNLQASNQTLLILTGLIILKHLYWN
ncbi:hypothetical protein K7432_005851 [Basidiobolus ranarum]|uniref:Uncharacterized protein n=1 Tax=Basidiobolus ranarum TaxID=34480 RepID=A0ABR2W2L7_9FUNG